MFLLYKKLGAPLELQQQAISYPGDTTCSTMCGTGDGHYSGDLPTFLYPFATDAGLTDVEIYWRDLELAYDSQTYCRLNTPINGLCNPTFSVTVAGQITATQQSIFFQAVGQSSGGTYCSINGVGQGNYQGNATGSCSYAYAINSAHGFH